MTYKQLLAVLTAILHGADRIAYAIESAAARRDGDDESPDYPQIDHALVAACEIAESAYDGDGPTPED